MPGMNGDELAIAIKQLVLHMPVIMLTGFGDSMQVSGEQPAGVDVIVNKPVTLEEFRNALENVRSSHIELRNKQQVAVHPVERKRQFVWLQ